MPKPIMRSEYGSDASARATPNSACTAGSTTGTTYMALAADRHDENRHAEAEGRVARIDASAWLQGLPSA